jgi:hypothetical protein
MPSWRLVLSGGARKLMVGFIVLGVLLAIGDGVIDATAFGNSVSAANAAYQVQTDVNPVRNAIRSYTANATACHGQLSCVTSLDRQVAATFNTFAGQLRAIPMPSGQSASNTASIFARLGAATSADQYLKIANSSGLRQSLDQVNQDYINLGHALNR